MLRSMVRVCGVALLAAVALGCAPPPSSAAPPAPPQAPPWSAPRGAATPAPAAAPTAGPTLGGRAVPPSPDRPVEKVTIGVLNTTSDVLFSFAEENGYFEHMRIEPVFQQFDSGGRMVTSLATNQIEAGGGTPSVGLYNAIARGVKVKMVADRASVGPGQVLMVRQELADTI